MNIQALVISPLDYCNSLIARASASATKPLQWVQNAVACLLLNLSRFSCTAPLFHSLHWHPVAGIYLKATVKSYTLSIPLRSATQDKWIPRHVEDLAAAHLGQCSILDPQWWNEPPTEVRIADSLPYFLTVLSPDCTVAFCHVFNCLFENAAFSFFHDNYSSPFLVCVFRN